MGEWDFAVTYVAHKITEDERGAVYLPTHESNETIVAVPSKEPLLKPPRHFEDPLRCLDGVAGGKALEFSPCKTLSPALVRTSC